MGVMALGLTVIELLKIKRAPTSSNCDKVALNKCALRVCLIILNCCENNSF